MKKHAYRVTRSPKLLEALLTKSEHLIVKGDDGSLHCATHGVSAEECAPKPTSDVVWTNSLDRGTYLASVVRLRPYCGLLTVTRSEVIVLKREIGISYDAPFGPDMEDVHECEQLAVAAADADYLRRGERPPKGT